MVFNIMANPVGDKAVRFNPHVEVFGADAPKRDPVSDVATPRFAVPTHRGPKAPEALFGICMSAQEVIVDYATVLRTPLGDILPINNPIYPTMAITTGLNFFWGALHTASAVRARGFARDIGDHKGKVNGDIEVVSRVFHSLGGAGFLAVRTLTLTALLKGIETGRTAPSLIGRSTYWMGQIGLGAFALLYTGLTIGTAKKLSDRYNFNNKLAGVANIKGFDDKEAVELARFLEKRTTPSMVEMTASIEKKLGKDARAIVEKRGREFFAKELPQLFNQLRKDGIWEDAPKLSKDDAIKYAEETFGTLGLQQIGLILEMEKLQVKKERKMSRVVSAEVVKMLNKASTNKHGILSERLQSKDPVVREKALNEIHEISSKMAAKMKKGEITEWMLLLAGVLGIASLVMMMVITAGTPFIVAATLFALSSLITLYFSFVEFNEQLKQGTVQGKYDKQIVLFSMATFLTMAVLGVSLAAAFSFGIPLLAVLVGSLVGLPWFTIDAVAYYKIVKAENAQKKRDATIDPEIIRKKEQKQREELLRVRRFWQERIDNQNLQSA